MTYATWNACNCITFVVAQSWKIHINLLFFMLGTTCVVRPSIQCIQSVLCGTEMSVWPPYVPRSSSRANEKPKDSEVALCFTGLEKRWERILLLAFVVR